MAVKAAFSNEMATMTLRYRAVCTSCDFKSAYTDQPGNALKAAADHQKENEEHSIQIITEQKTTMKYTG